MEERERKKKSRDKNTALFSGKGIKPGAQRHESQPVPWAAQQGQQDGLHGFGDGKVLPHPALRVLQQLDFPLCELITGCSA